MIKAENISKIYDKPEKRVALSGVSLVFPDTGLVVVAGESGCGKTTLVNILSGLDTPTSGSVEKDFDVPGAYVFQDSRMIGNMTLEENLRLAADITGEKPDIPAYLSRYGLEEVKDHTPNRLSAGQNQRAAVLRAVLMNRAVIFADEPTGNLDRENAERVAALLKEESAKRLVVTVTHDRELFGKYADRIIELDKGKVIRDDVVRESPGPRVSCAEAKPKLPVRAAMTISGRAMKRSLPRVISTAVVLFICLTLMAVSLNLVFTDFVAAKCHTAAAEGLFTYDLAMLEDMTYHTEFRSSRMRSVTEEEFAAVAADYDVERFKDMRNLYMSAEGEKGLYGCGRYYLSDECFFPIVCGNETIGENEVAVPESAAIKIFGSASAALGRRLMFGTVGTQCAAVTVSAVYADRDRAEAFAEAADEQTSYSCVMREETLRTVCGKTTSGALNGNYDGTAIIAYAAFMTSDEDSYILMRDFGLTEGRLPERENEIAVRMYGDENHGVSVGDEVTLTLVDTAGISGEFTYTVVGLYKTMYGSYNLEIIMSDEEYADIAYTYGGLINQSGIGIALKNYTAGSVRALHELGYCADMYFSDAAAAAAAQTVIAAFLTAVIAAAMAVAALIVSALFAGHLFGRSARTLGAMRAMGIGKAGLVGLLLMQPLTLLIAAAVPAVLLHAPLLALVDLIVTLPTGTVFGFLYYSFPASLAAIGFAALVLALSVAVMHFRMSRRTAIDIIYER